MLAPGVGFEPTRPEGHRLTVEPIPDMGQRAAQTARYQAPESRLNQETFQRLFSLLGRIHKTHSRSLQLESKKRLEGNDLECFLEKINESGDGSEPANNP